MEGPPIFAWRCSQFVSSLATRIIELKPDDKGGPAIVVDFHGNYEEYLTSQRMG